jgi:hypothetical protein
MKAIPAAQTPVTQQHRQRVKRPSELIWPLSVAQYHAMIDAGILTDDDPVEPYSHKD